MRQRTRTLLLVVAAAFLAAGVPPAARAQGANATLSGTVKDETGGVVPRATVTIRNQETSLRREVVTEAFNLTNRVNLALPSSVNLFDARGSYLEDAGRITSTSTSARQVQLGIKLVC